MTAPRLPPLADHLHGHRRPHWNFRPSRRAAQAGFTLLEILIATLLASTLLALLWGTFNMYLRMFETGERVTREAQLLLGMSRQFAEGIQGIPPLDPPPAASTELSFSALPEPFGGDLAAADNLDGDPAGDLLVPLAEDAFPFSPDNSPFSAGLPGAVGVTGIGNLTESAPELPAFGLVGSFDQLTLYGVQLTPDGLAYQHTVPTSGQAAFEGAGLPGTVDEIPRGAPELRIIHFRFLLPDASPNRAAMQAHRGLLRVDTAWHEGDASRWAGEQLEELLVQVDDQGAADREAVDQQIARLRQQREGVTSLRPDQLLLFAEVAGIKFRYFDGNFWRDTWDSRLDNRLPLAVDIYLQFRDEKLRRQRLRRQNQQRSPLADRQSREAELDEELVEQWNTLELYDPDGVRLSDFAAESDGTVYRLLIPCAGAASDARRTLGTESVTDSPGGRPPLSRSPLGGGL
jgi:prepilin-type N-terminal cleavage/methylation domain-containing protein